MNNDEKFFLNLRKPLPDASPVMAYPHKGPIAKNGFLFFFPAILMGFTVIAFLTPIGIQDWFTETIRPVTKNHAHVTKDKKGQDNTLFSPLTLPSDIEKTKMEQPITFTEKDFALGIQQAQSLLSSKNYGKVAILIHKLKQSLKTYKVNLQQLHNKEDLIRWYDILSEMAYYNQDLKKATDLALQSLEYSVQYFGKEHLFTAQHYEIISFFYEQNGDIEKALICQHNALLIYLSNETTSDHILLVKMNNMGEKYRIHKEYKKANDVISQTIEFIENKYGTMAPELSIPLNNLALVKFAENQRTKAEAYLLRAFEISRKTQGNKHHVTQYIRKNLEKMRQ